MTHNGSKKCNFWWLEWNNYFVKKKKVWPILIKLFHSLTISWAVNEWMLWRKRDSLTNDIWINKRGLFLLWKSFYEFQFLLILMSNYDHIWNIIQMFSFYERIFFLVLWVIRAAAVDWLLLLLQPFIVVPKMAHLIIVK